MSAGTLQALGHFAKKWLQLSFRRFTVEEVTVQLFFRRCETALTGKSLSLLKQCLSNWTFIAVVWYNCVSPTVLSSLHWAPCGGTLVVSRRYPDLHLWDMTPLARMTGGFPSLQLFSDVNVMAVSLEETGRPDLVGGFSEVSAWRV